MKKFFILGLVLILLNFSSLAFWTSTVAGQGYWMVFTRSYNVNGSIRYEPGYSESVAVLSSFKEKYIYQLDNYFQFSPPHPLVVIMDSGSLGSVLGSTYSHGASGAYQSGVILLGMYNAGLEQEISTLAHELGHHYVHFLARGNYPLWYTEGIAQMVEYKLTGRLWFDGIKNKDYYKYSIHELSGDFYGLEDQVGAYRSSLELVRAIENVSEYTNLLILQDLGRGISFSEALHTHTGMDSDELYRQAFRKREITE